MKNHWIKQKEINEGWHNYCIYFDASKTEVYVDGELVNRVYSEGELNFEQYVTRVMSEDVIKEIMLEEDAKFMEIVSATIDETPDVEICMPPVEEMPLEHHIDTMGI